MNSKIIAALIETGRFDKEQMLAWFNEYAHDGRRNRSQRIEKAILYRIKQTETSSTKILNLAKTLNLSFWKLEEILGRGLFDKFRKIEINKLLLVAKKFDFQPIWQFWIESAEEKLEKLTDENLLELVRLMKGGYYDKSITIEIDTRFPDEKLEQMSNMQLAVMLICVSDLYNMATSRFFAKSLECVNLNEVETSKLLELFKYYRSLQPKVGKILNRRLKQMNLQELISFANLADSTKAKLAALRKMRLDSKDNQDLVYFLRDHTENDFVFDMILEEFETRTLDEAEKMLAYGRIVNDCNFWLFIIKNIDLDLSQWLQLGHELDDENCWFGIVERLEVND